eukprot:8721503-Pyramimonas_sp.AAC.1
MLRLRYEGDVEVGWTLRAIGWMLRATESTLRATWLMLRATLGLGTTLRWKAHVPPGCRETSAACESRCGRWRPASRP